MRLNLTHMKLTKSDASHGPSLVTVAPRTNGCVHPIEQCSAMGPFIFHYSTSDDMKFLVVDEFIVHASRRLLLLAQAT